jgi:RecA/RadA recombinase
MSLAYTLKVQALESLMTMQEELRIIIDGEDHTPKIAQWHEDNDKVYIIYSSNSKKTYAYNKERVQFKTALLSDERALKCFAYLKAVAEAVGLQGTDAGNILLNYYKQISFIDKKSVLAAFLTGRPAREEEQNVPLVIYPFNFNLSQRDAAAKALSNRLTIIEGPPGTGKTQTILNIIANVVMQGKSVAVVSSNNSATANVFEKLSKYRFEFIAALLGSSDNKQEFIDLQKPLPALKTWKLSAHDEDEIKEELSRLSAALSLMLEKKNQLAGIRQQLDNVLLEYKHFTEYCHYSDDFMSVCLEDGTSDIALELWLLCEKYIRQGKRPGFMQRIINRFRYGVISKAFYFRSENMMIALCQKRWYKAKSKELTEQMLQLQAELKDFDFDVKMKEYTDLSLQIFRSRLAKRYKNGKRRVFELGDLKKCAEEFTHEYPVVLSTTYSLRNCLSSHIMYDYVIIDEASQVDLVTGALALSCAGRAVIVGDLKQLPNVVSGDAARLTDSLFTQFGLPESYRYKNNSLLSALSQLFPQAPKILLREHYRCHPKIIEFCNRKFYNNELIVLSEPEAGREPLMVYKTVAGNHARGRINQRQIDVIKHEVIPEQQLAGDDISVGIVTPYRDQTRALQSAFADTAIQADTVDKFQGREKDTIILSTVDNEITPFSDDAHRLNVAVSRAVNQLIVVINGNEQRANTNIADLVHYIQYNNLQVIQSEIYSVFDYLYKDYYAKKNKFLKREKRVSDYDSENLMYALICRVLKEPPFMKFDVAVHVPLNMIIRDREKLNKSEKRYVDNLLTHTDFLIFDKLSKLPCLIIEVDGEAYHREGTRQAERDKIKDSILEKYDLPLIRFRTTGSNERERLTAKLNLLLASS